MTYQPKIIAEWFIHRAGQDNDLLSQMKLQKLVYISHGWTLGLLNRPLISDRVEAWQWGPVIRSLYSDYARFGSDLITESVEVPPKIDDPEVEEILESVWEVYGPLTAARLSAMTHRDGTPWSEVYDGNKRPISNSSIAAHYKELAGQADE